jgi:TonB-linked SusC/RagA family outer membrane protein
MLQIMKKQKLLFTALFLLFQLAIFAQSRTIKGTVKDSKTNETIPGATVLVQGTTTATVTDVKGEFSIAVDGEGKKLIITSVGYLTQTVAADKDVIDVAFVLNTTLLKETVVTALGVSKEKKSIGYAVSEVKGDELEKSGEQNVIEALASKAAGIQVTSSGGTPGASSKITIRGNQTFTGENQPLIVIDGMPIDNSTNAAVAGDFAYNKNLEGVNNSNRALDINPDDIESVTILKGPAAAALYGARAGNGAILYTTKKGKNRKGLGITYSSSVEMQWVSKLPKQQDQYAQGNWVRTGNGPDGLSGTPDDIFTPTFSTADPGPDQVYNTADDVDFGTSKSWGPTIASLGLSSHNNTKDFFQRGTTYTNNIAVSGGNDATTYRFSYGNVNDKGVVPNTYLKRNTITLAAEHKVNEKLTVGTNINYANTSSQTPQNGSNLSGVMLGLMRAPASYDLSDYMYSNGFNKTYFGAYDNPYYSVMKNTYNSDVNRMYGSTNFVYKPLTWLDISYRIGMDNFTDNNRQVYAVSSNGDDNNAGYGQVNYSNHTKMFVNSDLLLTGRKNFGENIHSSLTVGNNITSSNDKNVFSRGRNLSIPDFYNLNNAAERYASNSQYRTRGYAFFLDGEADWKSKIFLGLTGRNEWSSTFGKKKNNFFYPGVNMAIVVSEMLKLPKWFSFAKLRIAYAESGIAPPAYSSKTYYASPTYTDGFTNGVTFPYLGNNGYAISNILGNPELKPERVKGQEYGADLRFFEGRLNLDVTYYYQKTVGILLPRPVAPSSGYTALYSNSGEMYNKGWEIMLTGTPVKKENFSWVASVNWAKNKSKVLKLAEGVDKVSIESGFTEIGSYAIVGDPYGAFYGTAWARNADGKLIIDPATGLPYVDTQQKNLGNPYPDWLMGIRNTLSYKKLSFSFLWDIRHGGKVWNGTGARMNNVGTGAETVDREGAFVIDGVLGDGTFDANGNPNASTNPNNVAINGNTYWRSYKGDNGGSATENAIQDGGWVRLRDVSISYRIDLASKTKFVQYLDLSVSGRNLYLHTKYKGVDPETSLTGAGSNLQGFDYFNNPGTKSIFFGVKLGF